MSPRRSPYESYSVPLPEPEVEGSRRWATILCDVWLSIVVLTGIGLAIWTFARPWM